jgi:hypothetical protein
LSINRNALNFFLALIAAVSFFLVFFKREKRYSGEQEEAIIKSAEINASNKNKKTDSVELSV